MRTLIIIFLALTYWHCHSQPKTINIPTYNDGDTTLWYGWKTELIDELKLDDLLKINEFRFRLWTDNQVIDVTDRKGTVTTFEREYDEKNYQKKGKLYSETVKIVEPTLSQFLELLKSSGIIELSSEEDIDGWAQGFDGITYTIEYSTAEEYNFRTYWTPDIQPELPEAVLVENFVQKTNELLNLKMVYDQFFAKLPKGCYNNGDIIMTCKE